MQEGEVNGKVKPHMVRSQSGQERHQISQKYTRAVSNAGSGNKVVRERLQSKEKTLLGNGKIKTEVDM